MARIAGVNLPNQKRLEIGLTYIYGIGQSTAKKICTETGLSTDEKIDGTAHLALGNGLPEVGGTNVSQLHWDIVKDMRRGGRIELDGKAVQEDGRWLL